MLGGDEEVIAHLINLIAGERGVGRHEEMATRRWDEGCYDANEIVVHIAGVTEGLCGRSHDCRYLCADF